MKAKPVLIVIAGPNGSGKTTVTEQLRAHSWMEGCRYINPDLIAQNEFGDWNSPESTLAAARRAAEIRDECLDRGESLAVETVFSAPDKITFVRSALDAGYFVRFFFVCTDDPAINVQRVFGRSLEGGHEVPMAKIVSRFAKSIAQCAAVVPIVNRSYIYDNSVDHRRPILLFRGRDGVLVKQYGEASPWARPILERLRRG